jgi:hypothetical protein
MRTWCPLCLLALGLVFPNWCTAQLDSDEARIEREQQEDVEVFRQVVTEAVQALYHRPHERLVQHQCTACHSIQGEVFADVAALAWRQLAVGGHDNVVRLWHVHSGKLDKVENIKGENITSLANHVPGHGIVVQLESPLPVVDRDVKAWVDADSSAPSRWEILRRRLRGEPEKNPPLFPFLLGHEYRRVHRLELTEKVVDVLVENGRNLRHLGPDERVTVAFTFRAPSKESKDATRALLLRHYLPSGSSERATKPRADAAPKQDAGGVMAGDLHLRQGHYAEAAAAYFKALEVAGVDIAKRSAPPPAASVELVKKLIQAQVGAGSEESLAEAKKLLDWLKGSQASEANELEFLRRAYLDLTGTPPTPEDAKAYLADTRPDRREQLLDRLLAQVEGEEEQSRLSSRMLVSCTKTQLDDVASGKLSRLDFASKITLKYHKGAPAAKPKVPPAKN